MTTDHGGEATIVAAVLGVGHDGAAEAVLHIRYPNGAIRPVIFNAEALEPALKSSGITTLEELCGRPWTILVPQANLGDNGSDMA